MPTKLHSLLATLALLPLLLASCHEDYDHKGKTPIAELQGYFLYREDLASVLPVGLNSDDSIAFAGRFIRNWAEETLLYDKARRNIPDDDELNTLVDNYRRALILHAYRQELIRQKLPEQVDEDELQAYYDDNQALFTADRGLVKGLFLKVPLAAPDINRVRRWYSAGTPEAIDQIEKYQMQNAVGYDYFYDNWLPLSDVLARMPIDRADAEDYVARTRNVELKDNEYYYFLSITDYCPAGQVAPYDYVRSRVLETLMNVKQVEFINKVKADLYERAVNKGNLKYY